MVQRNVLPSDPAPSNYDLTITPDFSTFKFEGQVGISVRAQADVSVITLNAAELEIAAVKLTVGELTQEIEREAISFDEANERFTVTLSKPFRGDALLTISYTGTMNDKMHGFYRSKYTYQGKPDWLGTTQFEAVDARRALPCWDEPMHKATFDVTLCVPASRLALSNSPQKSREPHPTKESYDIVKFERTPKMSTYLLAWSIGNLEMIERTIEKSRGGHTVVRVFTPEGKISQGEFALDVACRTLPLYEKIFGSDYLLPKVDLVAVPDFAAGAMENWGLITYRETALLCDESSSAVHRQWVALVVAHELAHQWFGNLVTMQWWCELWLNESFATWVEYWAIDTLFPDWQVFTQFVNDETGRALELDALRSSHAVEVDVVNAQEIDEIFDAISYSKGGSVLRMVIEFIGFDAFSRGISEYLNHFSFSNARTEDLWMFLGKAANKDLAPILAMWTGAQGYPFLTVDRPDASSMTISQHRFLSTGDVKPEEDESVWQIPLIYRADGVDADINTILSSRSSTIQLEATNAKWIKVNARQSAFCRVLYSSNMLESLQAAISSKAISNVDRLSIISDYNAFAKAGIVPTATALKLLSSYSNEDDYTVWCAIGNLLSDIRRLVDSQDQPAREKLQAFVRNLLSPALLKIGLKPNQSDNHRVAQLRSLLLSTLSAAGDATAIAECATLFKHRDSEPIPADVRNAVYATIVRTEGKAGIDTLKAMHEATTDAMERSRLLRALAAAKDEELVRDAIEYALSNSVRSQDAFYVLCAVPGNAFGERPYVDLVTRRFKDLQTKFPGMMLGRILKAIEGFASRRACDELSAFWDSLPSEDRMAMDRSFHQGLEGIRSNERWCTRDIAGILAAL